MRGQGFENMATVLVDPHVLADFELDLMAHDFRVWTVHTAPIFTDPVRAAFQIRRSLIDWSNGRWADRRRLDAGVGHVRSELARRRGTDPMAGPRGALGQAG